MAALALVSDLMMGSQVAAAAKRAGAELTLVASDEALFDKAESLRPTLVIVDLSHPGLDLQPLAARVIPLLPPGATLLAFGPHVHKGRLAAAAEAGFSVVLSRGQFHAEMDAILKAAAQ